MENKTELRLGDDVAFCYGGEIRFAKFVSFPIKRLNMDSSGDAVPCSCLLNVEGRAMFVKVSEIYLVNKQDFESQNPNNKNEPA